MGKAIKLALIFLGYQMLAGFLVVFFTYMYNIIVKIPINTLYDLTTPLALFIAFVLMGIHLWRFGYISKDRRVWSPISARYMVVFIIAGLASIFLVDFLQSLMPWLPDFMVGNFDKILSTWLGILTIAVFGPILEELLFRGAITSLLLKKYNPMKAIIISALIFGIFHINPAQVVPATIVGLFLGWIYYKSASLIPCIVLHVLNNSLSVFFNQKFPDSVYIRDLISGNIYIVLVIFALAVFVGTVIWLNRTTIPFPWKKLQIEGTEVEDEIEEVQEGISK